MRYFHFLLVMTLFLSVNIASAIGFNPPLNQGLHFPETIVGESSTVELTVSEPNDVPPWLVSIDRPQRDEFSVNPEQQVLQPGNQIVFRITFEPDEPGEIETQLTGAYSGPNGNETRFSTVMTAVAVPAGDPEITVEPGEIILELSEPGQRDEESITIGNGGEADLEFEIVLDDECLWLNVNPMEGSVEVDEECELTFSTTDVIPDRGEHYCEVIISSNDPENEQIVIPVTLIVSYTPHPVIAIAPETVNLEITEIDQTVEEILTISNSGERPLQFEIAVPEVAWLGVDPIAGEIAPGDQAEITVSATHGELPDGEYDAILFISSNDVDNSELEVVVHLVVDIPRPEIGIDRASVELETFAESESIEEIVNIVNNGEAPLLFDITPPLTDLISVSPLDGEIAPEEGMELHINSAPNIPNDSAGVHNFVITITSNDVENASLDVTVTLTILWNGVGDSEQIPPDQFELSVPYPNPFNSSTTITYSLSVETSVKLMLFDIAGHEVITLIDGFNHSGTHSVTLNASDLPTGLYFVRLEASGEVAARKVMLIR